MAEYGKIVILHLVQVEGLVVGVVLDDCVAALPVFSNRKRKTLPHLATPPLSLDFIQQADTKISEHVQYSNGGTRSRV